MQCSQFSMSFYEMTRVVACIGLPYVGCIFEAFVVFDSMKWYKSLKKPFLAPPFWIFGPVWSIIYGCVGLASLYVLREAENGVDVVLPLSVYSAQLVLSWSWAGVFFGFKKFKAVSL